MKLVTTLRRKHPKTLLLISSQKHAVSYVPKKKTVCSSETLPTYPQDVTTEKINTIEKPVILFSTCVSRVVSKYGESFGRRNYFMLYTGKRMLHLPHNK